MNQNLKIGGSIMKGKLAVLTNNSAFKKVAGAVIIIGGFLALKRLFRNEDEIIGEAEWVEDDDSDDDEAEDGE